MGGVNLTALSCALNETEAFSDILPVDLEPMQVKGLCHAHVRIAQRGLILRIPRESSLGLSPEENLAYQQMSFERASVGGHTPVLHGTIPPQDGIPMGALIVTEIFGRTPPLPDGLPAIARALASFHVLPVPSQADRFPLLSHDDPVAATLQVIEAQAKFLADAGLEPEARLQIKEELINARKFAADVSGRQMPITLVGSDTHPGNFILQPDGDAIFVDLEKVFYGSPAIDLAHATVYTSTMWDPDVAAALDKAAIAAFYDAYFGELPPALAQRVHPWCIPIQRLTWLRTITWCAKWRVVSRNCDLSNDIQYYPDYILSVQKRVDDYFDPGTISEIRAGFEDY